MLFLGSNLLTTCEHIARLLLLCHPDGLSRHTYLSAIKVRRPEHAEPDDQDCRGLLVPADLTLPS